MMRPPAMTGLLLVVPPSAVAHLMFLAPDRSMVDLRSVVLMVPGSQVAGRPFSSEIMLRDGSRPRWGQSAAMARAAAERSRARKAINLMVQGYTSGGGWSLGG